MIILRLRGGIGNQLFQYAAARSLAWHHDVPLKLDIYYYKLNPHRSIDLDIFQTEYEIASEAEIARFVGKSRLQKFFHKKTLYRYNRQAFAQPYYHFYPGFFELPQDIYISGYFQSEKYFQPYADRIRRQYVPRVSPDDTNARLIRQMQEQESVSVHIRHGDYATKKYQGLFGLLEPAYYRRAMEKMAEKIAKPYFFFFSDDMDWCRDTFGDVKNATFVEHNRGPASYWDMLLMSNCRHHILANSSFSWWGAWLNPHADKQVIAPQNWFRQTYYKGKNPTYPDRNYLLKDQLPDAWTRL